MRQFIAWQGEGDSKRMVGASSFIESRHKRNRELNRFLRAADRQVHLGLTSQPKEVLESMKRAENFLKGKAANAS